MLRQICFCFMVRYCTQVLSTQYRKYTSWFPSIRLFLFLEIYQERFCHWQFRSNDPAILALVPHHNPFPRCSSASRHACCAFSFTLFLWSNERSFCTETKVYSFARTRLCCTRMNGTTTSRCCGLFLLLFLGWWIFRNRWSSITDGMMKNRHASGANSAFLSGRLVRLWWRRCCARAQGEQIRGQFEGITQRQKKATSLRDSATHFGHCEKWVVLLVLDDTWCKRCLTKNRSDCDWRTRKCSKTWFWKFWVRFLNRLLRSVFRPPLYRTSYFTVLADTYVLSYSELRNTKIRGRGKHLIAF